MEAQVESKPGEAIQCHSCSFIHDACPGLTFEALRDPGNGMVAAWIIMAAESVVIMLCALWIEQVSL